MDEEDVIPDNDVQTIAELLEPALRYMLTIPGVEIGKWCELTVVFKLDEEGCILLNSSLNRIDDDKIPSTKAPCGECHLKPGEICDVCGAYEPAVEEEPNGRPH
jgi:hypothetical protein